MTNPNTPNSVSELRKRIVGETSTRRPMQVDETLELRFPQKLRAVAVGATFAACRPSFTAEDEDDLGYILAQLAGWVLHGNAYDPDLDGDLLEGLSSKLKELADAAA